MKVKKPPMPVWQIILYIVLFVVMIYLFMYLGTKNYNAPKQKLSDADSFTQEYGITDDNIYSYINAKDALEIMNTGSGIFFFAFPENSWSSTYADLLDDVAREYKVDKIYYYNFKNDRSNNNHYYNNIVSLLDSYIPVLDDGTKNIYAPTMVIVKNGSILYYDDETSIMRGVTNNDTYWTKEEIDNKKNQLEIYIKEYVGDVH